ncbi:MAG: DNA-binding protein WhiA [Oscillospiraceae bacterium]|nr:DNA-binding protein WhiA [Oscillospiraceae bacterium]
MPDFSRDTKEALSVLPVRNAASRRAELAALTVGIGSIGLEEDGTLFLMLQSENLPAMRRADFLLRALTGSDPQVSLFHGAGQKNALYTIVLEEPASLKQLLKDLGFMNSRGVLRETSVPSPEAMLRRDEARKAFLRGAFLAGGYLSDPEQDYHLEIVMRSEERAQELRSVMQALGITARITHRKSVPLIYLKESEAISDVLGLMGAVRSRLAWENARVLHSMKGNINRQVNCETANLEKSVKAGAAQIDAIRRIEESEGLGALPPSLREVAKLRLAYPDASLQELGERMDPPLGKSGVNHRLRRIMELAGK